MPWLHVTQWLSREPLPQDIVLYSVDTIFLVDVACWGHSRGGGKKSRTVTTRGAEGALLKILTFYTAITGCKQNKPMCTTMQLVQPSSILNPGRTAEPPEE